MNTNSQKNSDEQEVDLSAIGQGLKSFIHRLNDAVFSFIQFIIKNIIIVVVLIMLGVGIGLYLDTTNKTYDHELVVKPNFSSADYLYSKIALLNAKISERDTIFLKKIGIQEPSKLTKITIVPIVDIYQFINNSSDKNFELLRLMAEDSDIKKIIEDTPTSKNYPYHLISFKTKNRTNENKTIEPIMTFLNTNDFYSKVQKEAINNVNILMKTNEVTLTQIDNFLNGFANENPNGKSEKLIYYNENSPLNDIIQTKERLVKDQGYNRINLISIDKIIKQVSQTINIENKESINGKLKIVLPLIFLGIFFVIYLFINFYKSQSLKRAQL